MSETQLSLGGDGDDPLATPEMEERMTKTGVVTASFFRAGNPEKVRQIQQLRARGMGINNVAELVGCSNRVVMVIDREDVADITTIKRRLGTTMYEAVGLAVEVIRDQLLSGALKGKDAVIAAGVLTDKALTLGGEATVIHGVQKQTPLNPESWAEAMKQAKGRTLPPGTVLRGGEMGTKGALEIEAETGEHS